MLPADANKGPDLTLAIVDEAGAIQRVDGRKLDVDDALQAQAETLSFTVPATGRYIARGWPSAIAVGARLRHWSSKRVWSAAKQQPNVAK